MRPAVPSRCVFLFAVVLMFLLPLSARAGHLFTQASGNTPIHLVGGQSLQITQLTFEGASTNGNVSINFNGDWSAGDALKVTIGSYTRTFTFNSPIAGLSQNGNALSGADPTLAAAAIAKHASYQWTVEAVSGDFTFTGYRIYITDGTFNGTGAAPINQSQVTGGGAGGFSPSQVSFNGGLARQLDQLNGTAGGFFGALIAALDSLPAAQKEEALRTIAPETNRSMESAAVNTVTAGIDTVQQRVDAVRAGDSVVAHAFNMQAMQNTVEMEEKGLSSGDSSLKRDLWLKGFGGQANQDARGGYAGFRDSTRGVMLGFDTSAVESWIFGAALGYARSNVDMADYRSGDTTGVNTYQVTGYFSKLFDKWHLDGQLTYARQQYNTTRNTHVLGSAIADFDGEVIGGRLTGGMPFTLRNNFTLTPYVGAEMYHIRQSGYTETGASVLSLNVQSQSVERIRSLVGAELAWLKKFDGGGALRPSIKFNWRHEFNDDGVNTNTTLTGGGTVFETIGQDPVKDIFGLAPRLYWERNERNAFAVELMGEYGSDYHSYGLSLMGVWRF